MQITEEDGGVLLQWRPSSVSRIVNFPVVMVLQTNASHLGGEWSLIT
jgi:hypothetical protein